MSNLRVYFVVNSVAMSREQWSQYFIAAKQIGVGAVIDSVAEAAQNYIAYGKISLDGTQAMGSFETQAENRPGMKILMDTMLAQAGYVEPDERLRFRKALELQAQAILPGATIDLVAYGDPDTAIAEVQQYLLDHADEWYSGEVMAILFPPGN